VTFPSRPVPWPLVRLTCLDFVMVADHAALRRATVHEITAGAFAVVSVQLRVEALLPFIVACPVIPLLRRPLIQRDTESAPPSSVMKSRRLTRSPRRR
jgi:hypothetical protein